MNQFLGNDNYLEYLIANLSGELKSLDIALYMANLHVRPHDRTSPLGLVFARLTTVTPTLQRPRLILPSPNSDDPRIKINKVATIALTTANWKIRYASPTTTMHAKVWIFDSNRVIIGSHNLSGSSLTTNHDASIYSDDLAVVHDAKTWYDALWVKSRDKP